MEKRRWIGVLLARLILFVLSLEAASYVALFALMQQRFTHQEFDRARKLRVGDATARHSWETQAPTTQEVPHPFLGFTYNPAFDPAGVLRDYTVPVSEWGFLDDKSPIQAASPDRVVVGFFGGSVAFWTSIHGIEALKAQLSASRELRGKTLVFVRTALGAFKQPQQLMTLSYLLALGGHFDLLINLDGFNEIVLPMSDNIPQGYFPFYPRAWPSFIGATGGTARARLIGEISYVEGMRGRTAAFFSRPWLRWSVFVNFMWTMFDRAIGAQLENRQAALVAEIEDKSTPRYAIGPARGHATADAMSEDLAEVWMRSSIEMSRICAAEGIRYFHFLQPNQYVEGSKPIGSAEAQVALLSTHPYARWVRDGYPKLIERGRRLVSQGVDFVDLTQIFAGIETPLYSDQCCHLNPEGYAVLGRRIGRHVREAIDSSPPRTH